MPEIVVNKPQFNVNALEPGTAVRIIYREMNGYKNVDANAIVEKADRLSLQLVYMGKRNDRVSNELEFKRTTISIDSLGEKRGWTVEIIRGLN